MPKWITTPVAWLLIGAASLAFFIIDALVWLFTFWWDRRLWWLQRYSIVWALFYIWINPFWRINFLGGENIRKGQAYIIVSNHQSAMDILILYRLWMHFKWVAKREIFRIPVIGWNLWLNRHIAIDRASVKGALRMMKEADNHLKAGTSILIFPEGTRSLDGSVKRFKDGAFVLAQKTGFPILPVVLNGTREAFSKESIHIKGRQTFVLKVLPEISPENYMNKTVGEFTREVQQILTDEHRIIAPEVYAD